MDKIFCLEKIVPYSRTKHKILHVESFLQICGKVVKIAVPTKEIVILIKFRILFLILFQVILSVHKPRSGDKIFGDFPFCTGTRLLSFHLPDTTKPPPEGKAGVSERRRRTHEKVVVINLQLNCNRFDIECQDLFVKKL